MSVSPSTTARKRGVFTVFVLVVLLIPIQLLVKASVGREPYPALTQPAFAYSAGVLPAPNLVSKFDVEVEVTYSDGSVETLTPAELIPWTAGISQSTILTESLLDPETSAPETVDWLAARIADVRPGEPVVSARIVLYALRIDALTREELQRSVSDEVTVELGS